jgi:hypothetical protein
MREPQRMLDQAGSPEKSVSSILLFVSQLSAVCFRYLEQLRLLAANWANFDASTRMTMKTSAFLLASQRVPIVRASKKIFGSSVGAEEEYEREWVLCKATDVGLDACFRQIVR